MKNTLRALALAVPMAATIALSATSAQAEVFDPQTPPIIVQPEFEPEIDPIPADPVDPVDPQDGPQGPDDIAQPEEDGPQGPDDIAQPEDDNDGPQGPGDLTDVPDCPTHGVDCTGGEEPQDEDPQDEVIDGVEQDTDVNDGEIVKPTRVDAGDSSEDRNGLELAFLLAGGAVVATGGAFAARKLARR